MHVLIYKTMLPNGNSISTTLMSWDLVQSTEGVALSGEINPPCLEELQLYKTFKFYRHPDTFLMFKSKSKPCFTFFLPRMDKVAVCVYVCHSYSTGWKKDPGTRRVNVTFGDPHTGTHLVIRLGWIQEMEEKEPTQPQSTTCSSLKEGQGVGGTRRGEKSERAKGAITKGTSFQGPYLGKRSRLWQSSLL